MPEASDYLCSQFPDGDDEALAVIESVTTISSGVIRKRPDASVFTDREWDAICYLCDEWDYVYESDAPEPA